MCSPRVGPFYFSEGPESGPKICQTHWCHVIKTKVHLKELTPKPQIKSVRIPNKGTKKKKGLKQGQQIYQSQYFNHVQRNLETNPIENEEALQWCDSITE
ncbi:hypothetical protein Ahia01_001256700, partial [Argonauta hians]